MGNFCKDCKHARRELFALDYEYARCAQTKTTSDITGQTAMQQCYVARNYGPCGKDGDLFEPKRRSAAIMATASRFALAISAGAALLYPTASRAAEIVDRPDSNAASIGLALIFLGIVIGLASLAMARLTKVGDRPEDYDSAGRL